MIIGNQRVLCIFFYFENCYYKWQQVKLHLANTTSSQWHGSSINLIIQITVETLFCLMPTLKNCLISTYWLCFSEKLLRYAKCNFNNWIKKFIVIVDFLFILIDILGNYLSYTSSNFRRKIWFTFLRRPRPSFLYSLTICVWHKLFLNLKSISPL